MTPDSILVVTDAADVFDLTDLETVKDELDVVDGESDDRLSRYITEASRAIATWCKRVFARETVAETFRNGKWVACLVLARRPVVAIASVLEDGTALTSTDYELDVETGLLYRLRSDCRSSWCASKIVVTYDGGFDLPDDAPAPLSSACISLVKIKQSAQTRDPLVRAEDVPGVLSQQYWVGGVGEDGIPPEIVSLIAPYRNVLV